MPKSGVAAAAAVERGVERQAQRSVQSVEVGGKLLLALADGPSAMGLKDLAARAGLSPSRAHPYLVSFSRLGLVEQDSLGRYVLGPAALHIGLACLRSMDPLQAAEPVMRELAASSGHMVALAVWGNLGPTVVCLVEASRPLHVALRVGSVLSIFDTATGRAFASVMADDRLREAVAGPLGGVLPKAVLRKRLSELEPLRAEAKAHGGVSRALGTPIPGVNTFSAPVFDLDGNAALVLSVVDHQDRLGAAWNSPEVAALQKAARAVTSRLGGSA